MSEGKRTVSYYNNIKFYASCKEEEGDIQVVQFESGKGLWN